MRRPAVLVLALPSLLVLAACATSDPSPPPRPSDQRVRCVSDPYEKDTRPLFFLFCIQG